MATVQRPGLFVYYRWLVLLLVAGLCLVPLWATIIGGFKSSGELRTNALGLPWENRALGADSGGPSVDCEALLS